MDGPPSDAKLAPGITGASRVGERARPCCVGRRALTNVGFERTEL